MRPQASGRNSLPRSRTPVRCFPIASAGSRPNGAITPGHCGDPMPAASVRDRFFSAVWTSTEGRPMKRLIRPSLLTAGLVLALGSQPLWAQTTIDDYNVHHRGSVIGDDVLYSIGGGRAVSMGPVGQMPTLGVGIGWNSNLICGDMSITTTLQNQLNGITDGFQTIMSNVIQNATAAVASLPALIIQRADPGLYNLLTNGILQARLDFDRSKMTCRAIANRMADMAGGQLGWDQLAEGMVLKQAVASTDAVSAIE